LHILAESLEDAHCVLTAAVQAGFRESGAVNIAAKDRRGLPMVAVRSMGLGFDSIIGYQNASGKVFRVVDAAYLSSMMRIARNRFETNTARTKRFQINLDNAYKASQKPGGSADELALEKALRRQRKREEGLATQKEVREAEGDLSDTDATSSMPALAGLYE